MALAMAVAIAMISKNLKRNNMQNTYTPVRDLDKQKFIQCAQSIPKDPAMTDALIMYYKKMDLTQEAAAEMFDVNAKNFNTTLRRVRLAVGGL
jgi:hypothetical protein